ncbi:hypothetical protein L0U85_04855 [Glycomyces sp. L485]|uniref:hypothetical protein n=1 Tax=Glycomyces sp. L485 TaxID=2909235 RepID=UPI001F4AA262|nr:hypothetical protein [Glycomyces sp. L485]MCH7230194.1 hypothetical protein [Glycomyces sp. L485]
MGGKKLNWTKTEPSSRVSKAETKTHKFLVSRGDNKTELTAFKNDRNATHGRTKESESSFRKERDAKAAARRHGRR